MYYRNYNIFYLTSQYLSLSCILYFVLDLSPNFEIKYKYKKETQPGFQDLSFLSQNLERIHKGNFDIVFMEDRK